MWKHGGIKIEFTAVRNQWKSVFSYKTVRSPKFENWNFSGAYTHGFSTHSAFRISIGMVCKNFFVRVIPVRSRERAAKRDLPAKIGTVTKKRHGHNFWTRAPKTNSVVKKWVSNDAIRFGTSPSKIVAVSFFRYGVLLVKKKWNEGQLWRAVTRHEIIINYMSHTYSESPGRALSHGATQFMSYICKKMSKSRFRDPSEQGFLRFSELVSPD